MTAAIPCPATSMRTRLQKSTRALHLSVERHFALEGRSWTAEEYRGLLSRLLGIYIPMERALTRIEWRGSGFDAAERIKTPWLKTDLAHLGLSCSAIAALPQCAHLPDLNDPVDGLGALYVLEGATLGGRVILNALQPVLGISATAGGRFFASYGEAVGRRWREFLGVLEAFGETPSQAERIDRCAVLTFESFDRWFSAAKTERPNVPA